MIQDFVKPQKISVFYHDKQKSFVPKKVSTQLTPISVNQGVESFLGTKLFCFSRQNAENFCIFMIQDYVKPHKILAFYLDKQKSFVPKKEST